MRFLSTSKPQNFNPLLPSVLTASNFAFISRFWYRNIKNIIAIIMKRIIFCRLCIEPCAAVSSENLINWQKYKWTEAWTERRERKKVIQIKIDQKRPNIDIHSRFYLREYSLWSNFCDIFCSLFFFCGLYSPSGMPLT